MTTSNNNLSNGFTRFGLHKDIMRGIQDAGFSEPRPIQAEAIAPAQEGRDVLGLAQTGTGKTAAFALPLIDSILRFRPPHPSALILAPTRELANQIAEEILLLSQHTRVSLMTIYGGTSMGRQISNVRRRPDIIVGCPGRVLDLMQQGHLRLDELDTLVLDEADHMFDMGFLPDIRRILSRIPAKRQNLLFSATMPRDIRRLADEILNDPFVIELADQAPASTIDHGLYSIGEGQKDNLLNHLLGMEDCHTAIIFTRTKHRAKRLAKRLSNEGHRSIALQGNMSQAQRDRAMQGFRDGNFDILVATDIAARGIDVEKVSHVINYDVPNTPQAYTHRIGRTGRSEAEGMAYTFVTGKDIGWLRATERMIGSKIVRLTADGFAPDFSDSTDSSGRDSARSNGRSGGGSNGGGRGRSGRSGNGRSGGSGRSNPNNGGSRNGNKGRSQSASGGHPGRGSKNASVGGDGVRTRSRH
ncbi:MAG: DEAD/DEAH box helicase [Bacteroidetes bacterium]|nr:DEAD/DEAH box helicase [Bacteroidota bacterium]